MSVSGKLTGKISCGPHPPTHNILSPILIYPHMRMYRMPSSFTHKRVIKGEGEKERMFIMVFIGYLPLLIKREGGQWE